MKVVKPILKALLILIIVVVVVVGGYVIYVVATYDRIDDNYNLKVETEAGDGQSDPYLISTGAEFTALTYNVGFGAYDHEYSFFMDEGSMADGTETVGTESRAESKAAEVRNTEASIDAALSETPDILLFQEVDVKANRSYKVDQRDMILKAAAKSSTVSWTFASNFHSAYLFYPPTKPIGKISESGLLTVSSFPIESSVRRSYPVSTAFPTKFFDLDRCFSVNRMSVGSPLTPNQVQTGELVLINTHMSAYDEGGTIRREQMKLLGDVIADEYAKGNWVIVGGDFNHALGGTEKKFMNEMGVPAWVQSFDESQLPANCHMVIADNIDSVATCRDTSIPYEKGVNYEVTLDGFIVTDNVQASSRNIDADYLGTDHNPVLLTFSLLE
jgi:endonuclease/exonuclease/phosphatase family metal-dependent hydrolase